MKALGNLPSPSGVALELIRLIQSEHVSIDRLVQPVEADPALAGRLLKIVNSALFRQKPVLSIKEAVIKLGTNMLSTLAWSVSVLDKNRNGGCQAFDYDHFWASALLRGLVLKRLAHYVRVVAPEEAFTLGLIADIGRLALAQVYPEKYSECLYSATGDLLEHEQACFGIDHNQITVAMLAEWGLSELVMDAFERFQRFRVSDFKLDKPCEQLAAQLKLASLLFASCPENDRSSIDALTQRLGLNAEQWQELNQHVHTEAADWAVFLGLNPIDIDAGLHRAQAGSEPFSTAAQRSALRILVVDDDRVQVQLLNHYLTRCGYDVITLNDPSQALAMIWTHQPQLVISDYKMTPIDGLELCRSIRSIQDWQNIYMILITADKDEKILSQAFEAGVDDFICKPISRVELDARVRGAKRTIQIQTELNRERENIRHYVFDLASANRNLEIVAITDPLTQLSNRHYSTARLEEEWAVFVRHRRPLALLTLDLDKFKQINDVYGHAVGDEVLRHFAEILRQTIRTTDVACRIGGEEFIVIAPDTDCADLKIMTERIRSEVERNQPASLNLARPVTVSIGAAVANLELDKKGWSDTLNRSDKALYAAKAAGRNTCKIDCTGEYAGL